MNDPARLDPDEQATLIGLLTRRNHLAAGPGERAVYTAMLGPVIDEVDRLCLMEGIAYAEPATTFRPVGTERA